MLQISKLKFVKIKQLVHQELKMINQNQISYLDRHKIYR